MGRSSGSAERPPESITAAMADNFVIHDADDKDMDDKDMDDDKDWDIQIQRKDMDDDMDDMDDMTT